MHQIYLVHSQSARCQHMINIQKLTRGSIMCDKNTTPDSISVTSTYHGTSSPDQPDQQQDQQPDQQPGPAATSPTHLAGQPARSTCQINLPGQPGRSPRPSSSWYTYIYIYIFGTRYCPSPECSIQIKPHDGKLSSKISVAAGFHSSRACILGGARRRNSERA